MKILFLLFVIFAAVGSSMLSAQELGPAGVKFHNNTPAVSEGTGSETSAVGFQRTDMLTAVVLGFSVLHHADHVVRGNHSGWPFTSDVTPLTYSLAIYPIVGAAYAVDAGPMTFAAIDLVGTVGLLLAHSLLEPPHDQYMPWADGSNRLGVRSSAIGRAAQAVSFGLSLALAAHLASSVADGVQHGYTWQR